jgi:hypothetical protein
VLQLNCLDSSESGMGFSTFICTTGGRHLWQGWKPWEASRQERAWVWLCFECEVATIQRMDLLHTTYLSLCAQQFFDIRLLPSVTHKTPPGRLPCRIVVTAALVNIGYDGKPAQIL